MNFLSKIEQYATGQLNEVEKAVFEMELAESPQLQKELKAYNEAKFLIDFAAENLSEEAVLETSATHTSEQLINYAAQSLDENQILSKPLKLNQNIRGSRYFIMPQKYRLAAASLLLLVGFLGIDWWQAPYSPPIDALAIDLNTQAQDNLTPEKEDPYPEQTVNIKPEKTAAIAAVTPRSVSEIKSNSKKIKKTTRTKPAAKQKKPVKIMPVKQIAPENTQSIAQSEPAPIADNIATEVTIGKGEKVRYQAEHSITLKPGFYAQAGANFIANSQKSTTKKEIVISSTISDKESVTYKAEKSITLKPGFHAKVGASFSAITENGDD